MPSQAHQIWSQQRTARLDELLGAHAAIAGARRGSRWRTEQINWALTLRLAGEFQGYARSLHDLAVDHFVAQSAGANLALRSTLRNVLTRNRMLDRGNAQPNSLAEDFQRLGLGLWPALMIAKPNNAQKWKADLDALNQARNAIAHAQEFKITALAGAGYPINVRTIRRWKSSLGGLAGCMDAVVSDYLDSLFMTGKPW